MSPYRAGSSVEDGITVVTLESAEGAVARIAPELGNNCFAFRAAEAVLEPVTLAELAARPGSYGIPLMFPFPNRIRDGRFRFRGHPYAVDPARHGFVRDKAWRVEAFGTCCGEAAITEGESAFVRSSLRAADCGEAILGQFPFPFRLEVTYTLRGLALEMETVVINEGDRTLPWGFGIHPYFRKPEGGSLRVPAAERWELEAHLPTGRRLPAIGRYDLRFSANLLGLELDDVYTALENEETVCQLDDLDRGLRTEISFRSALFPNVTVFTPPSPRAAICIEPQTCPTDAFNLAATRVPGAGLRLLEPDESARLFLRIEEKRI